MVINFLDGVGNERSLKALTGLARPEFDKLCEEFTSCLKKNPPQHPKKQKKSKKRHQRNPGGGRKSALGSPENQLFFILFYLKSYPIFDVLAFTFKISLACAAESVHRLMPVLTRAQKNLQVLPKRPSDDPEEIIQLIEKNDKIIIDATERPHFRPQNKDEQENHYSGKKHQHTVKNTIVTDTEKRILILGKTVPGSQHDYSLFKEEFDPEKELFKSTILFVDLGYQGIKKDYHSPEKIRIPHKKPRKSKNNPDPSLTQKQRLENRKMSRVRVIVENAIGGIKIFHILKNRFRNKKNNFSDDVILAASGLWNLKNSFTVQ